MGRSNSYDARLCYTKAKQTVSRWVADAAKQGQKLSMADAVFSPGFLRSEVPLNATSTSYTFGILNTDQSTPNPGGTQFPTEQRLTLQDSFFCNEIGIYLRLLNTAGNDTIFQDELQSFPSAKFDGMGGTYQPDEMTSFWTASQLQIKVNNRIIVPYWDNSRHMQIEQTEYPIWTNPPNEIVPFDQWDGSTTGLYPCEPNVCFIGTKGNVVTLSLSHSLGADSFPTNAKWNAVFIARGVYAQNTSGLFFN